MKEEKIVKQYSDGIMAVVNSIRLFGEQFSEARIVEKVISTLPERYEAKRLVKTSLSQMLQEEGINPTGIAKDQVIQKETASLDQMYSVNTTKRWAMLKRFAEAKTDQCTTKEKASQGWLIDSGYTNHMTPDATIFKTINRSFKTKEKVGNGHFIKVEGKGDVLISTPTGNKLVSNVLLVPEIDRNLPSIAQLLKKCYSVVFKDKKR
ncbi:uncharacterized protein [Gossypium hirsutum]|uniref:Retrovirus-related Pol polyprotein from transposon TNT 1-94-like beta-barrel domain-containing protein n=1 Tax=Gossypium hirsutum TaxID=3635 RepID=A0A1U8KX47_GOSHI|nr:uncharacterized protein LOC107921682 [Gossypium hirsutum]